MATMLKHMNAMSDQLAVAQHHDAITGTHAQFVDIDYLYWMAKAFDPSKEYTSKLMGDYVDALYGVKAKGLKMCNATGLNDTAVDCPFSAGKEQLVVIQNPKATAYEGLVRIPLPEANFEAHIFNDAKGNFEPIVHDILETKHKDNVGTVSSDYTLYTKIRVAAGKPALLKLVKTVAAPSLVQLSEQEAADIGTASKSTLEVKGITEKNQVVFNFTNPEQGFAQSFGVSLKKYLGKRKSIWVNDRFGVAMLNTSESRLKQLNENPEGAYVFLPKEDDALPKAFGVVDSDVTYQKGKLVE